MRMLCLDDGAKHCAKDKPTDMRPPRNSTHAIRAGQETERAIEKLQNKPPAEKKDRRDDKKGAEEERREDHCDIGMRVHAKIGAHHRGDGPTRADGRQS